MIKIPNRKTKFFLNKKFELPGQHHEDEASLSLPVTLPSLGSEHNQSNAAIPHVLLALSLQLVKPVIPIHDFHLSNLNWESRNVTCLN